MTIKVLLRKTAFVCAVIISPLLLIIYALFWLWSTCVECYYIWNNYEKLNWEDITASVHDAKATSIVNYVIKTKGEFSVETMKELFTARVINAKNQNDKPLLPKFTQCIVERLDYWFWMPKQNFDISEHIYYHDEEKVIEAEEQLKEVVNEIINQPISFSKPLWEIILVKCLFINDTSEPKTAIIIRFHHSICDGISMLRILVSLLGDNDTEMKNILEKSASKRQPNINNTFKRKLAKTFHLICVFFYSPAALARLLFIKERHILHGPKLTGVAITNWSTNIKLQTIKDIKNSTSTTVNDVVTSCFAGAIRRYFIRKEAQPPEFVHVIVTVSLQGPNDNLKAMNRLSYLHPKLLTGDMNCVTRLKKIKLIMDKVKTSPQILAHRYIWKYFGSVFPNSVIRKIYSYSPSGIIMSNLPGPNTIFWTGYEVDNFFPLAPIRSSAGVGIVIFSYKNTFNIIVTMDSALISDPNDVSMLIDDIEEEIYHLYSCLV